MPRKKKNENGIWLMGVLLVAAAVAAFIEAQFVSALFLLVLGVGFMAYENPKSRKQFYRLFLKALRDVLRRINLIE